MTKAKAKARAQTQTKPKTLATVRLVVEGGPIAVDAILLHPAVMWRHLTGATGDVVAMRNTTGRVQSFTLPIDDENGMKLHLYDQRGQRVEIDGVDLETVQIPPFGFGIGVTVKPPI